MNPDPPTDYLLHRTYECGLCGCFFYERPDLKCDHLGNPHCPHCGNEGDVEPCRPKVHPAFIQAEKRRAFWKMTASLSILAVLFLVSTGLHLLVFRAFNFDLGEISEFSLGFLALTSTVPLLITAMAAGLAKLFPVLSQSGILHNAFEKTPKKGR